MGYYLSLLPIHCLRAWIRVYVEAADSRPIVSTLSQLNNDQNSKSWNGLCLTILLNSRICILISHSFSSLFRRWSSLRQFEKLKDHIQIGGLILQGLARSEYARLQLEFRRLQPFLRGRFNLLHPFMWDLRPKVCSSRQTSPTKHLTRSWFWYNPSTE